MMAISFKSAVQWKTEDPAAVSAPGCGKLEPAPKREKRVRVLHVVSRLGLGGTEHGVLKVMKGLGETQFEHRICAVRGIEEEFAKRMNLDGKTCAAGTSKPGFQFPLFRLARIMREFSPDVVHTRNFGALEAIGAARLARVPVAVHSEHGYELEILGGLPTRRRLLCRGLYAMADAVFTVTRELRSYHAAQSWLPEDAFRVIYNGVDLSRFVPCLETKQRVRRELNIPAGREVLGCVSRLVPIKDHATLFSAAEILVRQRRNVHVLVVGEGPERASLQAYVSASPELAGRVTFPGASDNVPAMLNAMDIFVLPSISEGMSNTILEAMASGLPVIATRSGGTPELVVEERTGYLFSPRDAEGLAQHLLTLIEDPARRCSFGECARQRVQARFNLADMIRSYSDLYLELLAMRAAGKGN